MPQQNHHHLPRNQTRTIREWSDRIGMNYHTLLYRLTAGLVDFLAERLKRHFKAMGAGP